MQPIEGVHMQAGQELNTLVAAKVMGWVFSEDCGVYYPPGLHPMNNIYGHTIPSYSTDIAAAWQVVEKLRDWQDCDFLIIKYQSSSQWDAGWYEWDYDGPVSVATARAESPPLAICLAALKAVGYKEVRS